MGSLSNILMQGAFYGALGGGLVFLFGQFFLNEDMMGRLDSFKNFWYICGGAFVFGYLLKYVGKVNMSYSKKKCIRCSKPSVMGSIYCEHHRRQAGKEFAMEKGVIPPEEDDENLGY